MMHVLLLMALCALDIVCAQTPLGQTYRTENFTAPNMTIQKTGTTEPGYLFYGPTGPGTNSSAPIIMTDENELVWYGPGTNPQNFRVQTNSNRSLISYWEGFGANKNTFGHGLGSVFILDNTYKQLYNICPPLNLYYANLTTMPCMIDNHESFITDRGSIIVTAFNVTQYDLTSVGGPRDGWIFDALFYEIEIETQKILFRWSSLEHTKRLPLTDSNYPLTVANVTYGNSSLLPWDYFHINSVQPIEDGYLVNSRYFWTVFLVRPNGKVGWRLEGSSGRDFTLEPGIFFSFQHDPRIVANVSNVLTLNLFNNDNGGPINGTNSTTGLSLKVDLKTRHVTQLRKLQDPSDPIFVVAQGSYWPLQNGHVLLGYGAVPQIKEFDGNGTVIYNAQFGYPTAVLPVAGYRAYRQKWHATPAYPPKAVADSVKRNVKIYLSWNGATDYDGWTIYGGKSRDELAKVKAVSKKGFETVARLRGSFKYLLAEATEGGKGIRNSTVVQPA